MFLKYLKKYILILILAVSLPLQASTYDCDELWLKLANHVGDANLEDPLIEGVVNQLRGLSLKDRMPTFDALEEWIATPHAVTTENILTISKTAGSSGPLSRLLREQVVADHIEGQLRTAFEGTHKFSQLAGLEKKTLASQNAIKKTLKDLPGFSDELTKKMFSDKLIKQVGQLVKNEYANAITLEGFLPIRLRLLESLPSSSKFPNVSRAAKKAIEREMKEALNKEAFSLLRPSIAKSEFSLADTNPALKLAKRFIDYQEGNHLLAQRAVELLSIQRVGDTNVSPKQFFELLANLQDLNKPAATKIIEALKRSEEINVTGHIYEVARAAKAAARAENLGKRIISGASYKFSDSGIRIVGSSTDGISGEIDLIDNLSKNLKGHSSLIFEESKTALNVGPDSSTFKSLQKQLNKYVEMLERGGKVDLEGHRLDIGGFRVVYTKGPISEAIRDLIYSMNQNILGSAKIANPEHFTIGQPFFDPISDMIH